jgi:hypothetical protein
MSLNTESINTALKHIGATRVFTYEEISTKESFLLQDHCITHTEEDGYYAGFIELRNQGQNISDVVISKCEAIENETNADTKYIDVVRAAEVVNLYVEYPFAYKGNLYLCVDYKDGMEDVRVILAIYLNGLTYEA